MQEDGNSAVELDDLRCPITLELFRDPVIAADGHAYEREAITQWIMDKGTSPLTREPLRIEDLRSDYLLRQLADQKRKSTVTYEARNGSVTLPPLRGVLRNHAQVVPEVTNVPMTMRTSPEVTHKDFWYYLPYIAACFCVIVVPTLFFGLIFGLSSSTSTSSQSYIGWTRPTVYQSVYRIYSGVLNQNSSVFSRTGNGSYYYVAFRMNVTISGVYAFWSLNPIDTYGYLYIDSFSTANLSTNLLIENDNWFTTDFYIQYQLDSNHTYILIVTTYSPNVTGFLEIDTEAPARIILY